MFKVNKTLFFIPIIIVACSTPKLEIPQDIKQIILSSGNNGPELRKVIDHYHENNEPEKLEAAYFLFRGMPYQHTYESDLLKKFDPIFALFPDNKNHIIKPKWDSLIQKHGDLSKTLKVSRDLNNITADFLINNIDQAFSMWNDQSWSQKFSNDTFYDYVLPYRCEHEQLKPFREDIRKRYSWLADSLGVNEGYLEAYRLLYYDFISLWNQSEGFDLYPMSIDYENLMLARRGKCTDESNLLAIILRGNGVPAAVDFTPQWANKSSIHSWTVTLDPTGHKQTIFNEEVPFKWEDGMKSNKRPRPKPDNLVNASQFYNKYPGSRMLPKNISVTNEKKVGKVYRRTFTANPEIIDLQNSGSYVPQTFYYPGLIDVTDQYVKSRSISFDRGPIQEGFAFLFFWDVTGWNPVAYGKAEGNQFVFDKVGEDALFLPAVIQNQQIAPLSDPFVIDEKTQRIRTFSVNTSETETISITRKYPLFANMVKYFNHMHGGRFEGANQADFGDAEILHEIDSTPYYMTEATIKTDKSFKYLRFIPKDEWHWPNVAELSFYDKRGQELNGEIIGTLGVSGHGLEKAFDDDMSSYYALYDSLGWVGLGMEQPASISKVKFCPRNDTNVIMPGYDYELFYWDGKWVSLERKIAEGYQLTFNKVPKNALLWLHCHTGGKEERPFTYEDGKQVWW